MSQKIFAIGLILLLIAAGFSFIVVSVIPDNQDTPTPTPTEPRIPPVVTFIPPTLTIVTPVPFTSVGISAVDKRLTILDGKSFDLSEYQGKIVILNFWATWCIPCVTEMPELQAYAANLPENVVIFAVTDLSNDQTLEEIRNFLTTNNITDLSIALDQHMGLHAWLGVQVFPATYFLDENGVVQREWIGEITRADIEQIVGELMVSPTLPETDSQSQ